MQKTIITNNIKETKSLGEKIARCLKPGDNVALVGELGSGKTTFTKGIAKGLSIKNPEYVNSPSFVLIREYEGRVSLYHFDLYRLERLEDIEYMGIQEYLGGKGVVVIEWAEKLGHLTPNEYLKVDIDIKGKEKRRFRFTPYGKRYSDIISRYLRG